MRKYNRSEETSVVRNYIKEAKKDRPVSFTDWCFDLSRALRHPVGRVVTETLNKGNYKGTKRSGLNSALLREIWEKKLPFRVAVILYRTGLKRGFDAGDFTLGIWRRAKQCGCSVQDIRSYMLVFGRAPASRWVSVKERLRVFKRLNSMRIEFNASTDDVKFVLQMRKRFGERGYLAALRAVVSSRSPLLSPEEMDRYTLPEVVSCPVSYNHNLVWDESGNRLYRHKLPASERHEIQRDRRHHFFREEMRRPFSELFRREASAKRQWGRLGVSVNHDCTFKPEEGIQGKHLKTVLQILGNPKTLSEDMLIPIHHLCLVFKHRVKDVLSSYCFKDPLTECVEVHDAGQLTLPESMEGVLPFFEKNMKYFLSDGSKYREFARILALWTPEWSGKSREEINRLLASRKYQGLDLRYVEIAIDCNLSLEKATTFAKFAEEWKLLIKGDYIPEVNVTEGKYTLRKLPKGDPKGLVLGLYTDCCQHPWGAGSECAKHGFIATRGGFYVVEKEGKIVAQSWVWLSRDRVLVMDNIETLGGDVDRLLPLYQKASRQIMEECWDIQAVHVGTGYSDVDLGSLPRPEKKAFPWKYKGYRDSESQRVLASR